MQNFRVSYSRERSHLNFSLGLNPKGKPEVAAHLPVIVEQKPIDELIGKNQKPNYQEIKHYESEFRRYYCPENEADSPFHKSGWDELTRRMATDSKCLLDIKNLRRDLFYEQAARHASFKKLKDQVRKEAEGRRIAAEIALAEKALYEEMLERQRQEEIASLKLK